MDEMNGQAMESVGSAFRGAMYAMEIAINSLPACRTEHAHRKEAFDKLSQIAGTLLADYDNGVYERRALLEEVDKLRREVEAQRIRQEYRDAREASLEELYIAQRSLALKATLQVSKMEERYQEVQRFANTLETMNQRQRSAYVDLEGMHENQRQTIIGLKEENEKLKADLETVLNHRDDNAEAKKVMRKEINTLRQVANRRRHVLLGAGKFITDITVNQNFSDLVFKLRDETLDAIADAAKAINYSVVLSDVEYGGNSVAVPQIDAVEALGKKEHVFATDSTDPMCAVCNTKQSDAGAYCEERDADENGVNKQAEIATVAEAIQAAE
jgi:Capsule polysaccharide export protein